MQDSASYVYNSTYKQSGTLTKTLGFERGIGWESKMKASD